MRLPEQRFWDRARRALGRKLHIERIENVVGDGFPDTIFLAPGDRVTPVELKAAIDWPAKLYTPVLKGNQRLSQGQMNWHLAWRLAGGRSAILVGVGSHEQFLFDSVHADELNRFDRRSFATLSVGRDWESIANWLLGERE